MMIPYSFQPDITMRSDHGDCPAEFLHAERFRREGDPWDNDSPFHDGVSDGYWGVYAPYF